MTYVRLWEKRWPPWHFRFHTSAKHVEGFDGAGWWYAHRCHRSRSGPRKRNRRG